MDKIVKFRWLIGFGIIVLCTIFQISGSSIGIWKEYLPQMTGIEIEKDGCLIGTPRPIRMDEWATFTPMAFSQAENKDGAFPYFSTTVRADETDMYIVYGQPVKSFLMIYRPFQLGYLLFGKASGLAFFWSSRLVILFLVAFDFFRLLTRDKRLLSLLGAVLISFSPVVSWWFFINSFVEMLIFLMGAVLAADQFLRLQTLETGEIFSVSGGLLKKLILILLLAVCTGGFILAFYPSWEIPLAYVTVFLILWVFLKHRKGLRFTKRRLEKREGLEVQERVYFFSRENLICFGVYFLLLGISFYMVLRNSGETIHSVLNTAYPGKRLETGGGMADSVFRYPGNLFYPFMDGSFSGRSNVCEMASFFDLFPMGILLSVFFFLRSIRKKKMDSFLLCMYIPYILIGMWLLCSWPELLAKVTLLSMSQSSRTFVVFGFLNVILLIYSLSKLEEFAKEERKGAWILKGIFSILLAGLAAFLSKNANFDYLTQNKTWFLMGFLSIVFFLCLSVYKRWGKLLLLLVLGGAVFYTGFSVNPVQKGIDEIYGNCLVQAVDRINDEEPGTWVVEGLRYPYINLPIMTGAATINSTNTYPDLERWEILDPSHRYEEQYNRYAHVTVSLEDIKEASFSLDAPDQLVVHLNAKELLRLGTKYILTNRELEKYGNEEAAFVKRSEILGYYIYQILG